MEPYTPKVPDKVRTVVYYVGVSVAVLAFLVAGAAFIWLDKETATAVAATAGLVGTGFGGLAASLGVAYNPLKNPLAASVTYDTATGAPGPQ